MAKLWDMTGPEIARGETSIESKPFDPVEMTEEKMSFNFEEYWRVSGIHTNPEILGIAFKECALKAVEAVVKYYETKQVNPDNPPQPQKVCKNQL
jgi:hypothetical protein